MVKNGGAGGGRERAKADLQWDGNNGEGIPKMAEQVGGREREEEGGGDMEELSDANSGEAYVCGKGGGITDPKTCPMKYKNSPKCVPWEGGWRSSAWSVSHDFSISKREVSVKVETLTCDQKASCTCKNMKVYCEGRGGEGGERGRGRRGGGTVSIVYNGDGRQIYLETNKKEIRSRMEQASHVFIYIRCCDSE
jgi:hypothetical protein